MNIGDRWNVGPNTSPPGLSRDSRSVAFARAVWRSVRGFLTTGKTGRVVRFVYHRTRPVWRVAGALRRALTRRLGEEPVAEPMSLFDAAVARTFASPVPSGPVRIPKRGAPLVSIIIPVHNQWQYTLWCLRSVVANSGDVPYEVIIADDASSDETRDIGRCTENVRVIRNDAETGGPLGFLKNCNAAAEQANGKYLLFLNNDTLVQRGWLQALADVAEQDERVGLVGSKLVYPDQRLQEAGGIIWSDGSGANYGHGGSPDRSDCNYLRDTDYVSGAAILVRHSLWREIGGFDERFAPAYYEDTDLAFEIRRRGFRVVYQPAAEVIHFEGVSHGTDTNSGVKQHQVINQRRFVEKWRDVLDREHFAPNQDVFFRARGHGRRAKHVLAIYWSLPTPDQDSGSLRMANMLRILVSLDCRVTLLPLNGAATPAYMRALQQQGVFAASGPGSVPWDAFLEQYGRFFDTVIVSRMDVGTTCMDAVKRHCPDAQVVFDTVDLHFLREQRHAELENDDAAKAAAQTTKTKELHLMRQADLTLVVSPVEQELLRRIAPDVEVRIVSNIHETPGCAAPFDARKDMLFIGGFSHRPNVDAIQWFVGEVFPKIRRRLEHVQLYVIGSHAPDELQRLAKRAKGVRLLGYVEDVEPQLRACRLSVVPLRYGAGVKGKINLSMSYGLPVVSTRIGCEGMFLTDQTDVLVADDADAMAEAVCRLYEDKVLWERLSAAGVENVRRHFSFGVATETLRRILEQDRGAAVRKPSVSSDASVCSPQERAA